MSDAYELVRDFIILHYQATRRPEPFWQEVRGVAMPPSLKRKIDLFADKGRIFRYSDELFELPSWVAVMLGQGIMPLGYDPLADALPDDQVVPAIAELRKGYQRVAQGLPSHAEFLRQALAAAKPA